ncbi:MAG: DUF2484 family protein [Rhodospirillaceae bacterium]
MSPALIAGCLWVVAAAITAMLPMRRQMVPGITLLIVAPLLIAWIGATHGWWWAAFGLFAVLSMFRNPLRYFIARALGRPVELPPDLRDGPG